MRESFDYTEQDRPFLHVHQIGTNPEELIARNEYDMLGRLVRKSIGGGDSSGTGAFQKVDYAYTVRGWLKGINTVESLDHAGDPQDLFAFSIRYDFVENTTGYEVKPLYNGNIAEVFWRTANDSHLRSYDYGYDAMNRLNRAFYQKNSQATHSYNEDILYDKNGNIKSLNRNGGTDSDIVAQGIDVLSYTYDPDKPNLLRKVFDASNSPEGFGNMTADQNKGITSISYNHLNLPVKIVFGSESEKIEYLYDAAGKKLKKTVTTSTTGEGRDVDYLDGFQYMNGRLSFFPTAEGYVRVSEGKSGYVYSYVYNYTDHLDNIRLSYAKDPENPNVLKILEENHYYPFGLKHTNYNSDLLVHRADQESLKIMDPNTPAPLILILPYNYKYNGKELQDELGLNMTAMDYRQYDSAIGRFVGMDRLSEFTHSITPYRFALNNPNYFNDPSGLSEFENNNEGLARCPTCPNTPEFKPLIDDPKNDYVYDPETKTATQVIQLEEVVVTGKTKSSSSTDHDLSMLLRKYSGYAMTAQKPLGVAFSAGTRYPSQLYSAHTSNVVYKTLGGKIQVPLGNYNTATIGKLSKTLKISR